MKKIAFMTEVANKITLFGFTRKEAVLIVRIERGVDNLDNLCKMGVLRQAEYYHVSQHVSAICS